MKVTLSVKEVKLTKPVATIARIKEIQKSGMPEARALKDFASEYVESAERIETTQEAYENYQRNGLGLGCYAEGMLVAYIFAVFGGENRIGQELGYSDKVVAQSIDICEVVVHPEYWGNGLRMLLTGVVEDIAKQVALKKAFIKCVNYVNNVEKLKKQGYTDKSQCEGGEIHILEKNL